MKSKLKEIGRVRFPKHTGERVYMLPFRQRDGLPKHLARWQPTVNAMMKGVRTDGPIYLMIDQGTVKAGQTHRRGGPHIDGNWLPEVNAHGGCGRHITTPAPAEPKPKQKESPTTKPRKRKRRKAMLKAEAIILASNISACKAYVGEIEGEPGPGGDCSHLNLTTAQPCNLRSGRIYIGNVTFVHESLPVHRDCKRTLVRLNVPGYTFI